MQYHPSWQRYKLLLAEQFGICLSEPVERTAVIRGHRLRLDEWCSNGEHQGTVILIHGGGGNGRLLAPFAELARACGWRVLAPDLPGYGLTEPAPTQRWDYAEWPAIIAELADQETGPTVLMGLSMGGMTAVAAAQLSAKVSAVIATTLLDAADCPAFVRAARWPWLGRLTLLGWRLSGGLLDRLMLPLRIVAPLRAMSSNVALQDYFCKDSLLGASWKPVGFFRTLHNYRLARQRLSCPLFLIHPGADTWTPTRFSLEVFARLETEKYFVELSNGAHLPLEQPALSELDAALQDCLRRTVGQASSATSAKPGCREAVKTSPA